MSYKSKPGLVPVIPVNLPTEPSVICSVDKIKLSNGEYNLKCPWAIFWIIISSVITLIVLVYFLTLFYTLFLSPYK